MSLNFNPQPIVYIISDSIGETGEIVVKAASSQFNAGHLDLRRVPYITSPAQIEAALQEAAAVGGMVAYTLVDPDLKKRLADQARVLDLVCVDIMGPVINALAKITNLPPKNQPGLIRRIDDEYLSRVAAIEFAVKFDDGKDPVGLTKADIVIVGISRTSKTPLCMYLAHKGIKAANVPLVAEIPPPAELFTIPAAKIIGLTIKPSLLFEIRKERLKTMGLSPAATYAKQDRILAEIDYAEKIMRQLGCPVLDVTNKATEETAARILEFFRKGEQDNAKICL